MSVHNPSVERIKTREKRVGHTVEFARLWFVEVPPSYLVLTQTIGGLPIVMIRKPIPGYEGLYEIAEDGRVFGVDRITFHGHHRKEKEMTQSMRSGYKRVCLSKQRAKRGWNIHRPLMIVFKPVKGQSKLEVRHVDGNPLNNTLSNPEWGTPKQNAEDRTRHGREQWGERNVFHKLTIQQASDILATKPNRTRGKIRDMALFYGVARQSITNIISGRTWGMVLAQHTNN